MTYLCLVSLSVKGSRSSYSSQGFPVQSLFVSSCLSWYTCPFLSFIVQLFSTDYYIFVSIRFVINSLSSFISLPPHPIITIVVILPLSSLDRKCLILYLQIHTTNFNVHLCFHLWILRINWYNPPSPSSVPSILDTVRGLSIPLTSDDIATVSFISTLYKSINRYCFFFFLYQFQSNWFLHNTFGTVKPLIFVYNNF